MEIILIGTGTGIPSQRRNPPAILIKLGDKTALFDSGPGTLKNLLQVGVNYLNLDFIFYSHLHLDHISEFAAILFASKIPPEVRVKPLTVYGPTGLKDYYKKIREIYKETIYTDTFKLTLEEIENREIMIDDFRISTKRLKHHGGGMGYRIVTARDKIFVYTGDTDYCDEAIELSRNADILVLECSFPNEIKMKGHLTPIIAGKIAQESNAKKIVFVHMYPVCDKYDLISQCKKDFEGEIIVGKDLMKFEL